MGVNRCTVWYRSPRLTLKTLRGFRGGTLCWSHGFDWRGRIWDRATVVLELLSLLFFPLSLSFQPILSFFLYTSSSFLPPFSHSIPPACLSLSVSLFSTALSEYDWEIFFFAVPMPAKKKIVYSGLKFHSYKRNIVAVPQGDWQGARAATFSLEAILPWKILQ